MYKKTQKRTSNPAPTCVTQADRLAGHKRVRDADEFARTAILI
jgi:hypothetical protein